MVSQRIANRLRTDHLGVIDHPKSTRPAGPTLRWLSMTAVAHSACQRRTIRRGQAQPAPVNHRPSALSKLHPQMITVSEPSAKAARRVCTGRSTPARSRSSAPRSDTPRHPDAWPIRIHTEALPPGSPSPHGSPGSSYAASSSLGRLDGDSYAMAPVPPSTRRRGRPGMRERA